MTGHKNIQPLFNSSQLADFKTKEQISCFYYLKSLSHPYASSYTTLHALIPVQVRHLPTGIYTHHVFHTSRYVVTTHTLHSFFSFVNVVTDLATFVYYCVITNNNTIQKSCFSVFFYNLEVWIFQDLFYQTKWFLFLVLINQMTRDKTGVILFFVWNGFFKK